MSETNKLEKRKLSKLAIMQLAVVGGSSTVYALPYLIWTYYTPIYNAFGVSHEALGNMMTIYGIVAAISYFIGGYLADKFNPTKLLTVSLISCGLLSLALSTIPTFVIICIIQMLFGVFATMLQWSAMLKVTALLSKEMGEGLGFSGLESSRKLWTFATNAIVVSVFAMAGEGTTGLQAIYVTYAVILVLLGVMNAFAFKGADFSGESSGQKINMKVIVPLLKKPAVWLIGLVIFAAYLPTTVQGYQTAYLVEFFSFSETQAALVPTVSQFIAPFLVIAAGWLADRKGINRILFLFLVLTAILLFAFISLPAGPSMFAPIAATFLWMMLFLYCARGIMWALTSVAGIPTAVTGTVMGVLSFIGYSPDLFIYSYAGSILDNNPGVEGYRSIFYIQFASIILGLVCVMILVRYIKATKDKDVYADIHY